jgi:hypothetical protein
MRMSSSLSGHFKLTIVHILAIAETISIVSLVWERETPCPHLRALISTMERGEECFVASGFKGQLDDGCVYVGLRNVVRQAYTYVEKMLENERAFGFGFEIGLAHLFYSISHLRKFVGTLSPSHKPRLDDISLDVRGQSFGELKIRILVKWNARLTQGPVTSIQLQVSGLRVVFLIGRSINSGIQTKYVRQGISMGVL